jgi:hypothetical protein
MVRFVGHPFTARDQALVHVLHVRLHVVVNFGIWPPTALFGCTPQLVPNAG